MGRSELHDSLARQIVDSAFAVHIDAGLRLDLIVGGLIIVEIKAIERLLPVHGAQLLTYLKLAEKRLGILVNFNVPLIKDGIRRLAL